MCNRIRNAMVDERLRVGGRTQRERLIAAERTNADGWANERCQVGGHTPPTGRKHAAGLAVARIRLGRQTRFGRTHPPGGWRYGGERMHTAGSADARRWTAVRTPLGGRSHAAGRAHARHIACGRTAKELKHMHGPDLYRLGFVT